jgi:C4-dicarboxylate transporter
MKKAIKAVLLSAFIFPGVGHLLLKRYISAAILATTALTATYLLIAKVLENAMLIVDKIQRGEVAADITTISELVSEQPSADGFLGTDLISSILLITWLVAIIDCYRIGRSQKNKAKLSK